MTQEQRRLYLIQELLKERPDGAGIEIPTEREGQKRLLRSLFNLRQPQPASQEFLAVQDAYLQEETRRKGVTSLAQLRPVEKGLYLWQGQRLVDEANRAGGNDNISVLLVSFDEEVKY